MERYDLEKGGIIFFEKEYLSENNANELFSFLKNNIPWGQEKYDNKHWQPRLTAWYANDTTKFSYSGLSHTPHLWTDYLLSIKKDIEEISKTNFNSLLINYYRSGHDYVDFHSDNELIFGKNPIIASLSLGYEREFIFRYKGKSVRDVKFWLNNGSLLLMGGTIQHHWEHSIPRNFYDDIGPRINLTFRKVIT